MIGAWFINRASGFMPRPTSAVCTSSKEHTGDGRETSDCGVTTVVIIQMQPRNESSCALGFRLVEADVGPLRAWCKVKRSTFPLVCGPRASHRLERSRRSDRSRCPIACCGRRRRCRCRQCVRYTEAGEPGHARSRKAAVSARRCRALRSPMTGVVVNGGVDEGVPGGCLRITTPVSTPAATLLASVRVSSLSNMELGRLVRRARSSRHRLPAADGRYSRCQGGRAHGELEAWRDGPAIRRLDRACYASARARDRAFE